MLSRYKFKRLSIGICLVVLGQFITPNASALPEGIPETGSTRVVPIYVLNKTGIPQPNKESTLNGFLFSPRIVFTTGVADKVFERAQGGIFVGKPGSKVSDTSGRVKVVNAFYSTSARNENGWIDDFVIFILESDLAPVSNFPLLTESAMSNIPKEATALGYGEYLDRCAGKTPPCASKNSSEIPRKLSLKIISLAEAEKRVGYKRPQLSGQIVVENAARPQDGVNCRGDSGSPVIGSVNGISTYMGAISWGMNTKYCGAVPIVKVLPDKPKIDSGFDGISGITFFSPVYKHQNIINEAQEYVKRNGAVQSTTTLPTSSNKKYPYSDPRFPGEYICGGPRTKFEGFSAKRNGKEVDFSWPRKQDAKNYLSLVGELYIRTGGEKLPSDLKGKMVCSFLNDSGNKIAISLVFNTEDLKTHKPTDNLWYSGKQKVDGTNQWVFLFTENVSGLSWDFRPIVDRDESLSGSFLRVRCVNSYWVVPFLSTVEFSGQVAQAISFKRFTRVAGAIKDSNKLNLVNATVDQFRIASGISYDKGELGKDSYGVVSGYVKWVNGAYFKPGEELELAIPGLSKRTSKVIVKSVSAVDKTIGITFLAIDAVELIKTFSQIEEQKKASQAICPALN